METKCVDSVRVLAAALPQQANSGHPGAPMGCAPMAHVLWSKVMSYSPSWPKWWNRDRFVLSNGHACALHYTMLHLTGYELTLDDLKAFRTVYSKTPGHPEVGTVGIEVTTGPLGQGISQAVGLALASSQMAARYNKPDIELFNNFTYVICGDGCLQEGVSSEACSLAGHLKLGRLICLYDSNGITIDGSTDLSFSENVGRRYEAYGWHVVYVQNGDSDLVGLQSAVETAKQCSDKPSLIVVKTTIGFGSLKEGSEKTHGAPLGLDDLKQCRAKFGLPADDIWNIDSEVLNYYRAKGGEGDNKYSSWIANEWTKYSASYKTEAEELKRRMNMQLPEKWKATFPVYTNDSPAAATRALGNAILNAVWHLLPEIIGGSADLTDSNKVGIKGEKDFTATCRDGRYIRYGVREHGMSAITNGIFGFGGFRPFCATFLNFITYAWGAVRLSALSHSGVLYIATHDSIELGEDGPTHQPVELLPLVRSTPNIALYRPCDGNESVAAFQDWLTHPTRPTVIALCRSNVSTIPFTSVEGATKGAYVVANAQNYEHNHKVILAGSGSEMQLCLGAQKLLEDKYKGLAVIVVSMPCWEKFEEQTEGYRTSMFPSGDKVTKVYVEGASTFGWEKYFDVSVGMTTFGLSGSKDSVWKALGFTEQGIADKIISHLAKNDVLKHL